jgi:hypothetical protein
MKTPEGEKPHLSAASARFDAALVGLILTPILVNVVGGLAFRGHRSYQAAQGLGTLFFFLSIPSAPLGALYWWIALTRSPRRLARDAAVYVLLVLAAVLAVGGNYIWSRA